MPNNHISISNAGIALIKQHEGVSLSVYLCPANKPTIGYGHVIMPKWDAAMMGIEYGALASQVSQIVQRKTVSNAAKAVLHINPQQAEAFLKKDLQQTVLFIHSVVHIPLNQHQFEFDKWTMATVNGKKVRLEGLVTRRAAERALFESAL